MSEKDEVKGTEGIEESKLPVISSAKDIFEEIDPEELVKALEKRVTGAWTYEFPMEGKMVRGLSSVGADETALFIAQKSKGQTVIRIMPGSFKSIEEPDCFKVEVMAGVYVVGFYNGRPTDLLLNSAFGFSKMPKRGIRKDKSTWDIPHAEAIALTKAQRNAKAHLIPDRLKQVIMREALKKGKMAKTDPDSPEESAQNGNGKESERANNGNGDESKITSPQRNCINGLLKNAKVKKETRTTITQELEEIDKNGNCLMSKQRASDWIKQLYTEVGIGHKQEGLKV